MANHKWKQNVTGSVARCEKCGIKRKYRSRRKLKGNGKTTDTVYTTKEGVEIADVGNNATPDCV